MRISDWSSDVCSSDLKAWSLSAAKARRSGIGSPIREPRRSSSPSINSTVRRTDPMTMTSVTPAEAQRLILDGAKLIDIRDPDEHAREHIPGADNVPLAEIDRLRAGDCPVVFHCRSGGGTGAKVARLSAAAAGAPCYMPVGGETLRDAPAPDEQAREHIPGADTWPLAESDRLRGGDCPVVCHCRSGARTGAKVARLSAAAAGAPCYLIEGGIDAWRRAGLEVAADRRQPLEMMRQVQLAAGGLVLLGVALGFLVCPGFFPLSAVVGVRLTPPAGRGWFGCAGAVEEA